MESIKKTLDGAKEGWNNLDKKKKIIMVTSIIAIILIVSVLTYNNNKINYALLFSNLELQDAGIIVNDLETNGIKYKIENNGRNILIDENKVDEYRLQLAMNGMMPESSTGFEIFDDTGMMVTDEDRQIMYQRALTGELQRSIMSLDAIESAKVHLVMPEKSIFETEEKAASASVIIGIKPSQKVTQDMIRGIVALVSGAVDNLPEENIQVIDTKGNLLSGFLNEDQDITTMDIMSQYDSIRNKFEDQIESSLMKLLGNALGKDKVMVSVLADLDFDSEETTVINYSNPIPISEQIEASGGNIDIQTVTGGSIDDNISNVMDSVDGDDSTYSRIINNELSSETRSIIKAPGKVNRLTTSVVYNGNLSDENLAKIQNIVAAATGYDSERGDIISVEGIMFNDGPETGVIDEGMEEEPVEGLQKYLPYILRGLGILALLIIIILTIRNVRRKKKEDIQFQEQLATGDTVESTLSVLDDDFGIQIKPDDKGDKAQKYAKENPDLAADLIRTWLKDQG
ncbi:flagellar basal-body MS-ring/collar protein FliF [Tissierella sp. Yu-01]|uniref:flagellar basal-body MS-ring/collar protein FliF n=1 Tax=Tissierella sp. Yu-01 TaxID=3035694 RepID=UPI00240DB7A5|nr:flagellar basal-body MS-ring/collar protein FliF [Tissierella sp. Yu-01]WFA07901.1 flagellar basal-body MS-ring/collar protein FliF [Tissierella sp. Yu-01]